MLKSKKLNNTKKAEDIKMKNYIAYYDNKEAAQKAVDTPMNGIKAVNLHDIIEDFENYVDTNSYYMSLCIENRMYEDKTLLNELSFGRDVVHNEVEKYIASVETLITLLSEVDEAPEEATNYYLYKLEMIKTKFIIYKDMLDFIDSKMEVLKMYNIKEMFNEENFDAMDLTDMIYSAMNIYDAETHFNKYIWISLDTLEAEEGAREKSELEDLENGFIVEITSEPEEDIWDRVVRCFVDFFNENFDRDFEYEEWYEPFVEENDEEVFTDEQLQSVFETCHNICLENMYEEDPYYIMIDMQNYKAVKSVKKIEGTENKYIFLPVEPLKYHGLTDVYDNCANAIELYFDTEFEMNMVYNFEIY